MYPEELKELLESNKNIKSIWFNEDGVWHTSNIEDFTKEVKREDILKPAKKQKSDE